MSATNTTTNLGLSQFVNTDVPAWRQDYNGDMLKIDNAYTADISSATAETSADPSDYMKFYDVSATTNKKILISDLLKGAKVEDLTDTDITTPVDDDGLVYDATSQKWENVPIMTKEQWKKNGAYNVGYHNFTTQTLNGITFTVNADKSITLNNTATATTTIHLFQATSASTVGLKEGTTYKLVGLTPTTPSCTLKVNCYYNSANHVAEDSGNGATFTFTGTSYGDFFYDYYLTIPSGTAFNNDTIYPMITTDLNATYADYQPYAKTNRELTEDALTANDVAFVKEAFNLQANSSKTITLKTTVSLLVGVYGSNGFAYLIHDNGGVYQIANSNDGISASLSTHTLTITNSGTHSYRTRLLELGQS